VRVATVVAGDGRSAAEATLYAERSFVMPEGALVGDWRVRLFVACLAERVALKSVTVADGAAWRWSRRPLLHGVARKLPVYFGALLWEECEWASVVGHADVVWHVIRWKPESADFARRNADVATTAAATWIAHNLCADMT
jgi:hypothetical protein